MISERMRSPTRTISRGICWSRRMTPSARPRSTTTWPNSTRLTTPVMTSLGAVLELFILALALGVADLLEDDLLGGLGGDAAELDRRQRVDDEVADGGALLQLLRALQVDLLEMILGLLDHFEHPPQAQVAGFGVELGADVVLGAVAGAGGALDGVLHRLDDDALVDQLFARDGVGDGDQLGLVGADGSGWRWPCDSFLSVLIVSAPSVLSGAVALMSLSVKSSLADAIAGNGRRSALRRPCR